MASYLQSNNSSKHGLRNHYGLYGHGRIGFWENLTFNLIGCVDLKLVNLNLVYMAIWVRISHKHMQNISTVIGGTALSNGRTGFYSVPTALVNVYP